ncbi:MAG: TolC family protein [Treponema sp.]|nr:TolC family protein [Treponema sp.]
MNPAFNKKIKSFAFTLGLLASAFLAPAVLATELYAEENGQKTVTLTVDSAVDYAKKNSRTLKSADIDLDIKRRASAYSWNVLFPDVTVSGTMSRANSVESSIKQANAMAPLMNAMGVPFEEKKETESMHWTAVGNVTASLNLSLAYINSIRAAKADYEAGIITWEKSQKETLANIKKLFYGLLLAQENLDLQKRSLENARQRSSQAAANFRNGRIPELALLQAQVTYQNKVPEVEQAEMQFKQQKDMFAFLLGMPVGTEIVLDGSIEPEYIDLDADSLMKQYLETSLDYKSLQATLNMMNLQLGAANMAAFTPALALSYSYQPVLPDALDADWGDKDAWVDNGSFSVTLAWKVSDMLPWSKNRQQAKDLKANIQKLELSLQDVRENQRMKIQEAVDNLKMCREQIQSMQRNVTLAQRSYNMTAAAYMNGTRELLDLRDAENQLNQAKLGLANQKYNYISSLLDLETLLGIELKK